jgi:hypothetical protein
MKKKEIKVFIIHGFEGHPNGGWRPWLMGELEKQGIYSAALVMKSPNTPRLAEWVKEIEVNVKKFPKDEIILIGHSLGVPAILKFLQTTKAKNIKANILVSGPYKDDRKGKVANLLKSFFVTKWDFKKIKKAGHNFTIIHGSNDQMVHFSHAEYLAENLNGKLMRVENGGHLNGSAGFYTLPECLNAVLEYKN